MVRRELTTHTSAGVATRRVPDRRRGPIALLTAVTSGLGVAREARTSRERVGTGVGQAHSGAVRRGARGWRRARTRCVCRRAGPVPARDGGRTIEDVD